MRTLHGPRREEVNIGVANVNLADARLHEAEKAYQRTQQLHEGFTVTRVQIDQAERDARMAAALLDEVRAKLALLRAGSREEDIAEARSRRDAAKARVNEAAARLGYCTVDAPIQAIVLSTNVSPGQLVSPIAPVTLLTLVNDSKRRVRAYVDEREIAKVCPRERARITADGVPGIPLDGVVESIGISIVTMRSPTAPPSIPPGDAVRAGEWPADSDRIARVSANVHRVPLPRRGQSSASHGTLFMGCCHGAAFRCR